MKQLTVFLFLNVLGVACNNNQPALETSNSEIQPKPEAAINTETNQAADDNITGNWKLKLEAYDDNENKIPDEEEKKKGIKNNYSIRINADGSCRIQQVYKGRYELKTENGNKMLYVFRNRVEGEEDHDPPPDVYQIISLSKNEMILLEDMGQLVFWIFERT